MPISNKYSENRMTKTSIRIDPTEAQRRKQVPNQQRTTIQSDNNHTRSKSTGFYPEQTRKSVNIESSKISVKKYCIHLKTRF
jgi:hypothetical protein